MKPKTNMQKEVFRLSKTLSGITNAQKKYAIDKYTSHLGIKTSKGIVTCLDCANKWKDTTNDSAVVCPHCGRNIGNKEDKTQSSWVERLLPYCNYLWWLSGF